MTAPLKSKMALVLIRGATRSVMGDVYWNICVQYKPCCGVKKLPRKNGAAGKQISSASFVPSNKELGKFKACFFCAESRFTRHDAERQEGEREKKN